MVKTCLFKDRKDMAGSMMERAKRVVLIAAPTVTTLALPVTALAADTSTSPTGQMFEAISAGMQSAIQDMVSSVGAMAGSMIPYLFPLVSLGIDISICFVLVRRVTNNA